MNTTSAEPVTMTVAEYNGPRTLSWTRRDRHNTGDGGAWSGDPGWVKDAQTALAARAPVQVLAPGVDYEFDAFDGSTPVEEVAAAMIAAAGHRAECSDALDELPRHLLDDDAPDDAVF